MIPVVAAVWLTTFAGTPVVPGPLGEFDRINLERNLRWMLARERATPADRKPRVGVFADAGVWHVGAKSIVESLEAKHVWCRVLDRSRLTTNQLTELEALVLPGGWAPFQWAAAGEPGLDAIREYVERGGPCLGVCAGAYLLSKTVRYDDTDYPYPLGLFDGTARGPVAGLAAFPTPGQARLSVTAAGRSRGLNMLATRDQYYSGGPCFVGGSGTTVLAAYPDGSAACVVRKVGKGEVILCGVHAERPTPPADDTAVPPGDAAAIIVALLGLKD